MSQLSSMFAYAQAFELAYLSDDWSVLAPLLTDDAKHVVTDGGPLLDRNDRGRNEVLDGFRNAVHEHDRRFDLRIPEIFEGPVARDDGIWMRFGLTTRRAGLPDLTVHGEHLVRFDENKITAIEEKILDGSGARTSAFFEQHAAELRPPTSGPVQAEDILGASDLQSALIRSIVRSYGSAKSQQDIEASLAICHDDFWIETVCFGVKSRDKAETAGHLALFFDAFPDYAVTVDGLMTEGEEACLWGRARMTLAGSGLGVEPTGKTAELPIFCVFTTRGSLLTSERFFFDLADLCRQVDVPIAQIQESLEAFRASAA